MRKSEYFDVPLSPKGDLYGPNDVLVPNTCLSKAEDSEPIFVLRANDPTAADIVEIWALLNSKDRTYEKIREAQKCAEEMRHWKIAQLQARLDALDENRGEAE